MASSVRSVFLALCAYFSLDKESDDSIMKVFTSAFRCRLAYLAVTATAAAASSFKQCLGCGLVWNGMCSVNLPRKKTASDYLNEI